ncbi:MAG TPA: hypothetical protein VKG79_16070 [Bryobacteraceae bacterium]|nr:hypothetical protein [Bryobacteraceae bacterium]
MDEDVRAKLEAEMRKSGKSFKETVNETLRVGLLSRQKAIPSKPFKVRPKAMGLKPGYSYDKVWELIEQVEGPEYK